MANVTGSLATFGFNSLAGFSPELWFIPTTEGFTDDGKLRAAQPVQATINSDQTFTAYLVQSGSVRAWQPFYYTIEVRWLDPGSNYTRVNEFPGIKVRPPTTDAVITDVLVAPVLSDDVWISPGGVQPEGAVPGDLIYDPTTDDLLLVS